MTQLVLEHEQPMLYGPEKNFGIRLEGSNLVGVEIDKNFTVDDILVHNKNDKNLAILLSELTYNEQLPVPIGVLYQEENPTYEDMMVNQINEAIKSNGNQDLQSLVDGFETWQVK